MVREILFKAKEIKSGKWVYGYYKKVYDMHFIDNPGSEGNFYQHIVDKNTICQYTGLTDKNGNKIWENDIINKPFYTDWEVYANSEGFTGYVKYEDCAWCIKYKREEFTCTSPIFMALGDSHDSEYYEVIGNIFDNPELLKGE